MNIIIIIISHAISHAGVNHPLTRGLKMLRRQLLRRQYLSFPHSNVLVGAKYVCNIDGCEIDDNDDDRC